MLTEYIERGMAQAKWERMEDGRFFASVPNFKGLWADGDSTEECLSELRTAFEEWLVICLREDDELPDLPGISLNFGGENG